VSVFCIFVDDLLGNLMVESLFMFSFSGFHLRIVSRMLCACPSGCIEVSFVLTTVLVFVGFVRAISCISSLSCASIIGSVVKSRFVSIPHYSLRCMVALSSLFF